MASHPDAALRVRQDDRSGNAHEITAAVTLDAAFCLMLSAYFPVSIYPVRRRRDVARSAARCGSWVCFAGRRESPVQLQQWAIISLVGSLDGRDVFAPHGGFLVQLGRRPPGE